MPPIHSGIGLFYGEYTFKVIPMPKKKKSLLAQLGIQLV